MEEIIDLIATDAPAHEISDGIKRLLYTKGAERIEAAKPLIASTLFGETEETPEEQE